MTQTRICLQLPQDFLHEIIQRLIKLKPNDAMGACLKALGELREEYRSLFLSELSQTRDRRLVPFFMEVVRQCEGPLKDCAEYALMRLAPERPAGWETASQERRFLKAFASRDRFEGKCTLTVVWTSGETKPVIEAQHFLLSFNHAGIKDYYCKKYPGYRSYGKGIRLSLSMPGSESPHDFQELTLLEAAALLQDAYGQNIRFNSQPASGINDYGTLLQFETGNLIRQELMNKFYSPHLTARMVGNIYLRALKNMDAALLYDLSSQERQAALGERSQFIFNYGEELKNYTFLRTQVTGLEKEQGKILLSAYVIVNTPQDEIVKISYDLTLVKVKNYYYVDKFSEIGRQELAYSDSDNPLNYRVFCSAYHISSVKKIQDWLESQKDILLTGEFESGYCYKWLTGERSAVNSYDITDGIVGEFILRERELLIYAKNPVELVQVEGRIKTGLTPHLTLQDKYYLPVQDVYRTVVYHTCLNRVLLENYSDGSLRKVRANWAVFYVEDYKKCLYQLQQRTINRLQLDNHTWYLWIKDKISPATLMTKQVEYYLAKHWVKVNVFNGTLEEEIRELDIPVTEIIYGNELENYYDLFTPPVSEERKWEIYKGLHRIHKESIIGRMGFIPRPREIAQKLGSVKRTN
ncbi:MAG: hypothetical protein JG781_1504 [Peptococcaceae bacterium]|nr:hypothetical protein [Peptococcaceae bacterium]